MRTVSTKERIKRGCNYCTDQLRGRKCKHDQCPYKELDNFKTYEDYYKSTPEFLTELLKGVKK